MLHRLEHVAILAVACAAAVSGALWAFDRAMIRHYTRIASGP